MIFVEHGLDHVILHYARSWEIALHVAYLQIAMMVLYSMMNILNANLVTVNIIIPYCSLLCCGKA